MEMAIVSFLPWHGVSDWDCGIGCMMLATLFWSLWFSNDGWNTRAVLVALLLKQVQDGKRLMG